MTGNQKQILKWQERARKEIARLESLGWKMKKSVIERANAPLKERYTKRQMEAMHDLLSISHVRRMAQPVVAEFTAKRSAFQYKRDKEGNIEVNEKGIKQLDMKKVTPVKAVERKVAITPTNAGSIVYDTVKRAMTSHPSREAADLVHTFLIDLERTSGQKIFPTDVSNKEIKSNIMKYVPNKKELNRMLELQALAMPEVVRNQQVGYKRIGVLVEDISRLTGTTETEYAAKMRRAYDNAKETFGKTHSNMKQSSIEKVLDFFEYSGSVWQKYRNRHDSDDFVRQFDEMEVVYDDRNEEPDWEYLNVQLEKDEPVSKIFEEMRKRALEK